MSTDTIALFEAADASRAVQSIHDCAVQEMPDALCAVGQRYLQFWRAKQWEYDDRGNLLGPGGFSIRGENGIVEVYHLLRYSTFALQSEDGRLVLAALRFISGLIGSVGMIIIHELLPWQGSTLADVARSIEEGIGPPANSWRELSSSDLFKPGCWMRLGEREGPNITLHGTAYRRP